MFQLFIHLQLLFSSFFFCHYFCFYYSTIFYLLSFLLPFFYRWRFCLILQQTISMLVTWVRGMVLHMELSYHIRYLFVYLLDHSFACIRSFVCLLFLNERYNSCINKRSFILISNLTCQKKLALITVL